jgi:hypothetical protein
MYSNSIAKALQKGQNRFELCHQAFQAIRKLHSPGNRVQDTTNDALQRIAGAGEQQQPEQPENVSKATLVEMKQESFAELSGAIPQPEPLADNA